MAGKVNYASQTWTQPPAKNFGASPLEVVGPGTTTYLKFNLSGVPAGATVSKATLRVFVDAVVAGGNLTSTTCPARRPGPRAR
jgi:hypothetical protein